MAISVSGADGAILPPFVAGLLPPHISASVEVEDGPRAVVETLGATAAVAVSGLSGSVEVRELSAGVEVIPVSAEVGL